MSDSLKTLLGAAFAVKSRRYGLPLLGQGDHGAGVQHAVSKQVVELQSDAVHEPVEPSLAVVQRVPLGSQHGQVLDVAPRQLRATQISRMEINSKNDKWMFFA